MKLLWFHDIYINRKFLLGMLIVALLSGAGLAYANAKFELPIFIVFFILVFGVLRVAMTTLEDNTLEYMLSLPIDRMKIVYAKFAEYLTGCLFIGICYWSFGNILGLTQKGIISMAVGLLVLYAGYWSLYIPMKLYLSSRKQWPMVVFWMLPAFSGYLLKGAARLLHVTSGKSFWEVNAFSYGVFALGIGIFILSFLAAVVVMKRKDC